MTWRNMRTQGWVFPWFSPDSDDRVSLNFHRFVIFYRSCDTWSVGLGHYCLPKVSNGFKEVCVKSHFLKLRKKTFAENSFSQQEMKRSYRGGIYFHWSWGCYQCCVFMPYSGGHVIGQRSRGLVSSLQQLHILFCKKSPMGFLGPIL